MAEHDTARTVEAPRPTGKRQAHGVSTTRDSRPVRRNDGVEGRGTRNPMTFLKQVFAELRKVIWPTGKQMVIYTIVVLLFLAFTVLLVWGVDWLAGNGVSAIYDMTEQ